MDIKNISLSEPKTYFQLIEKVGSKGPYQRNVFIIFLLNWFTGAMLLLAVSFLFMRQEFDCQAHEIETNNCEETICAKPQNEWEYYLGDKVVESLSTEFGPYMCRQGDIKIDIYRTLISVGTMVGYIGFLYVTDNYGRKISTVLTWVITAAGVFLLCIAQNMQMALVGIFFAGAGCESSIRISMAIFGEIVQYKKRQRYSIGLEIGFAVSGVLVGVVYWIFREWRIVTILFCAIPCFVDLLFLIFYLEETPRFLLTKKTNEQALRALNRIGKINTGQDDLVKVEDIQRVKQFEKSDDNLDFVVKPWHLFTFTSLRTITIVNCILFFTMTYLYIGPFVIVDKLGLNPFVAQIVLGSAQLIAYPISFAFIDRTPRKKSGYILFGLSGIFTGILIFVQPSETCNTCAANIIQIILVFGSRFCVSYYFSILFLYVTELLPSRARGMGFGVVSAVGALASGLSQFSLRQMQQRQFNPMIVFTIMAFASIYALKFLKETLNKPLETEIKEIIQCSTTGAELKSKPKENQLVEQQQDQSPNRIEPLKNHVIQDENHK